jgi:uncharacterized repeat protein (TIGR01451 family)
MTMLTHRRYAGLLPVSLLIVIVGVFLGEGWIISLVTFPLSFLLFGALSSVPDPEIEIERTIDPKRPVPSDTVSVTLTVENVGDTPIPDIRIADGVPENFTIVDSSPSFSTALAPGDIKQIEYTLRASRDKHVFDPPKVRVRGIAADQYRDPEIEVSGDKTCTAEVFIDDPPTVQETKTLTGAITGDTGGSGIEFHTVRQYRPGDPINRIDWRRLARQGDLWTIDFAEYSGVSVFILADCRSETNVHPTLQRSSGIELTQYAADRIVHALEIAGHESGFGALSQDLLPFVKPGTSKIHVKTRTALRSLNEDIDWDGSRLLVDDPSDGVELAGRLMEQLQSGTQVVFISPLGDDLPVTFVRKLRAHGYPVSVIVPGLFDPDDVGKRLVHTTLQARLTRLRDANADIITWPHSVPLPVALSGQRLGEHA